MLTRRTLRRIPRRQINPLHRAILEALEPRQLLTGFVPLAPTASPAWLTGYFAPSGTVDLQVGSALAPDVTAAEAASLPRAVQINAAGLPLLESRPNAQGLPLYLDMSRNDGTYGPYSIDGDRTTYNTAEQLAIYKFWRKVSGFFSQFNVNITTVLPGTGGSDPNFAWIHLTNDFSGGAAYVNSLTRSGPTGHDNSGDVTGRVSGAVHELGHILGLGHQSAWDALGNLTAEYTNADGYRNVPIMGIDYNGSPNSRFFYGRANWNNGPSGAPGYVIQDDVQWIANTIIGQVGGDGFRPDEFGNTIGSAYTLVPGAQQLDGYIERYTDADVFKISPTAAGSWNITATPLFGSQLRPNLELLDANGNLIAARNDANFRNGPTNEQFLNITLAPGTYYVRVTSNGDYDSLGYYKFGASQLPGTFVSNDVGIPAVGGSVTYNDATGVFTQSGGGTDIWNSSDQFRYTYQTLNGNGTITARIDGMDNIGYYSKAGVMVRQSLNADSQHAYMGVLPNNFAESIWRTNSGGTAVNGGGPSAANVGPWVRITRTGNVFTFFTSADGTDWNLFRTTTITMTGPVLIGLATCSWDNANPRNEAFATFSNVVVEGNTTPSVPSYNGLDAPTGLTAVPASTASTSINLAWSASAGAAGYVIERSVNGVDFAQIGTVGSGVTTYTDANVWGSMRWFYRVSAANGTSLNSAPSATASTINKPNAPGLPGYTAPVIKYTNSLDINFNDVQGETGYRLEISSNGGSSYTVVANLAANETARNILGLTSGTAYKIRLTPYNASGDGPSTVFDGLTRLGAVANLRFTAHSATGNTLAWDAASAATGYNLERSTDGVTWGNVATLGAVNTWSDTNVTSGTEYYYRVFAFNADGTGAQSNVVFGATPAPSLPSGWAEADIGTASGPGAAVNTAAASWTLVSSGSDIAGAADSFHFAYQALTSDTTIIAKIDTLENTNNAAKAGIMFRQDLTAGSKFVAVMMNAGGGFGIDLRSRATANTNYTYQSLLANATTPYWLKITKSGNTLTAAISLDGATWTNSTTRTIAFTGTFYVGLAGTAFSTTALNTSTFTNVSVGGTLPTVATPASATPNPATGTTTNLSVLGNDTAGEANLTYTWSAIGTPPAPVLFSSNGTNAARNTVATFAKAGTYSLSVLVQNSSGLATASTVSVTVSQTLSGIVAPAPAMAAFTAQTISMADQFGNPMPTPAGTVITNWATTNGSITPDGLLRAPGAGNATVSAIVNGNTYNTPVTFLPAFAWYKADQTAGPSLTDSSGNNRTGTLTGGYSFTPSGVNVSALTLAGGYAQLPNSLTSSLNDFTIATWLNPTSTAQWSRVFDFGTGTTANMFLTVNAGSGLRFAITTAGGGSEQRLNGPALAPNTWTHVAITLTGTTATLFVNGAAVDTQALTLKPSSLGATTQNYLGKSQYSDPAYQGSIDDFRLFNAGLSANAVAALYQTTRHTPQLVTAATPASTNITAGTTTTLAAQATTFTGNASLTYTWSAISFPAGANVPTYSANGTNAAKNATVTFHKPGTYVLRVTIADPQGLAITSDTATLTFNPLLGDANGDGNVDLGDFDIWLANVAASTQSGPPAGDLDFSGLVDLGDFDTWLSHVGATAPITAEPAPAASLILAEDPIAGPLVTAPQTAASTQTVTPSPPLPIPLALLDLPLPYPSARKPKWPDHARIVLPASSILSNRASSLPPTPSILASPLIPAIA